MAYSVILDYGLVRGYSEIGDMMTIGALRFETIAV